MVVVAITVPDGVSSLTTTPSKGFPSGTPALLSLNTNPLTGCLSEIDPLLYPMKARSLWPENFCTNLEISVILVDVRPSSDQSNARSLILLNPFPEGPLLYVGGLVLV